MIDDRRSRTPQASDAGTESSAPAAEASLTTRALAVWPRLDRGQLARAHGDPRKIAQVITRRTVLPVEAIVEILVRPAAADLDPGPAGNGQGGETAPEEHLTS
jgi:hypothetical protein